MQNTRIVYLDHAATTPVLPEVVEAMLPYFTEHFGNSGSVHRFGRNASNALESARDTVAHHLNAQPKEIVFTGCGSEADNLALRGVMFEARKQGKNHLITSVIEHKAVLDTAKQLRDVHGFELTVLGVDEYGRVGVNDVLAAIRPNSTALISIMAANNEIGTLQPIEAIGALAREHDVLFHTDAVQAISSTAWDMRQQSIDLLTIAPHKFNGPKGIGILYVRDGVTLVPSMTGGGQEHGLRPGTTNVAFAVGAATALAAAQANRKAYVQSNRTLRDQLVDGILALGDQVRLTGHPTERLPFHASFAVRHLRGGDMLMHLDTAGIAASSGSACSVGNPKPSRILEAIGLDGTWTTGGLRFSVGKGVDSADIAYAIETTKNVLQKLERLTAYQ